MPFVLFSAKIIRNTNFFCHCATLCNDSRLWPVLARPRTSNKNKFEHVDEILSSLERDAVTWRRSVITNHHMKSFILFMEM